MAFTFHVKHHLNDNAQNQLKYIRMQLGFIVTHIADIKEGQIQMALDLSRIQTEVAENNTIIGSAVALLTQVAEDIRNNVANQTALNALADQLDSQSGVLAAAVADVSPAPAPVEPAGEQG